jgi:hypothetical protein
MPRRNGHEPETTDGPRIGHNVEARAVALRKAFDDIFQTEAEIDRQVATHVAPLREHRTEAWKNLKNDVNMDSKVLRAHYAQYKMARAAQESGANDVLDDMREAFQALHHGQTLDWVAAVTGDARPAQPSA